MNPTLTDDNPTLIQHSLPEQHQNSTQDQPNTTAPSAKVIPLATKGPMNPTPLEYSWWSTHPTAIARGEVVLFVSAVITIGVLIIYLMTPKAPIYKCRLNFQRTVSNPLAYNYNPRSVTIGDFNNDTWPDFVVSNAAVNNISVFLASNNGTFAQPTTYPTGSNSLPNTVAVAHLNNDQHLDIAVAYFGSHSIGIFLGLGNGSFVNHTTFSTGSARPIWIHIAHLDNDTFLDLVTADYGTDRITLFTGDGTGNFAFRTRYPTGYDSSPVSVTSGDFNNDNQTDLAVANSGTNNVGIFFGDENGEFSNQKLFSTGIHSYPNSIAVGHLNNDVLPDIAIANYGSDSIAILLNTGNRSFDGQTTYVLGDASPYAIVVADINKDKRSDLVVASIGTNNIGILLGHGNGYFLQPIMFATGSVSSISVTVDHLNKDDLPDIAVVSNDTNSVSISFGKDEDFQPDTPYSTAFDSSSTSLDPLSDNSQLNMINASSNNITLRVRRQNAPKTCRTDPIPYVAPYALSYIVVGDFNNDSHVDIAFTFDQCPVLGVSLGYGNGSFANKTVYQIDYSDSVLKVADVNGDALLDIVVAHPFDAGITVLLGYGNGSFAARMTYPTGAFSLPKTEGDFNNDTILDLVDVNPDDNNIGVLLGYGNGSFAYPIIYYTGHRPMYATVSDFNNDDRLDIVVANSNDDTLRILLGYGNGSFSNHITCSTGRSPTFAAVADFNEDGRSDVVVANYQDNYISVLISSQIQFTRMEISSGSGRDSRLQCLATDDFNNDGILDIVVVNYGTKTVTLLLGHGDGSFREQTRFPLDFNSNPQSLAIGDFNKDNQLDLAIGSAGTNNIDIFLGNGRGLLTRQRSNNGYNLNRLPMIIVADDFDHDGYSEVVVAYDSSDNIDVLIAYDPGNFTDQTTYANGSRVESMVMGDFNEDRIMDLVIVNSHNDTVGVLLGNGDGSFATQTTYPSGGGPQSIAIGDFNNDTHLDIAFVNYDDENIGIMLGYGNGSFANQITHPVGDYPWLITVNDFNNDNLSDIVVVQERTPMKILLGYGNGSFAEPQLFRTNVHPLSLTIGDVNNDTFMDIIVIPDDADYYIYIFLGYGNGSFQAPIISEALFRADFVTVGDFNNDARLDIVLLTNPYVGTVAGIFLGYGNGSFAEHITYSVGCQPMYVSVADLNNDAQLDIVIVNHAGDDISVFLGDGTGSFVQPANYSTGSSPYSLVISGFNNDTRMDIAVANWDSMDVSVLLGYFNQEFQRHRTLTTGNGSHPRSFATGDFNNDIHPDIAVVSSGTDILGIFLGDGNGAFSTQISSPTIPSPSLIAVSYLNNDTHLDAVVVSSDHGNIVIHLGHGNGSFVNYTTYSTGANSKPKTVSVADFDNDTILDIIIANPDPSNVLVFAGDGHGNFVAEKEIWIGYGTHAFAVAVGDFNKDKKLDFSLVNYGIDDLEIYLQTC